VSEVPCIEPRAAAAGVEILRDGESATFPLRTGAYLELLCKEESGRRVIYASLLEAGERVEQRLVGTPSEAAKAILQLASHRAAGVDRSMPHPWAEAPRVEEIVRGILGGKVVTLRTESGGLELRLITRRGRRYISVRGRDTRTPSLKVRVRGTLEATARILANALSNSLPPQARPRLSSR